MIEIPGYTLIRKLGHGGMATVYLALQESLERQVAIKIMHGILCADSNFCSRFFREGRIAAQLDHPNIVSVLDIGEIEGNLYMVLEYLEGGTLSSRIAGMLNSTQIIGLVRSITKGLSYAHSKDVIHRDLKPENILFNHFNNPKLTDFGIAKSAQETTQLTSTGMMMGSIHYLSPEQGQGLKHVDHRSDIYSLGVILYQIIEGNYPFTADTPVGILMQHVTAPIPQLIKQVPFQPIPNKMLAKNPDDRFNTANDVLNALETLEFDISDIHKESETGTTDETSDVIVITGSVNFHDNTKTKLHLIERSINENDTVGVDSNQRLVSFDADEFSKIIASTRTHEKDAAQTIRQFVTSKDQQTVTAKTSGRIYWMSGGVFLVIMIVALIIMTRNNSP